MTLALLVLLPFLSAFACYGMRAGAARWLAVGVPMTLIALLVWSVTQSITDFSLPWLPGLGINFSLKLTGLNVLLLLLTPLLTACALLLQTERQSSAHPQLCGHMMLLLASLQGVFLADNLGLFYIFFELMLLPTLLIVSYWGNGSSHRVAIKFLLYTLAGSLPMLLGIVQLATLSDNPDLSFAALSQLPDTAQWGLFGLFFLAFAVKLPLFPLHGWLVDLYESSPAWSTAVIAGAMSKAGLYGFLKICLGLLPVASVWAAPTILLLASCSLVYGAVCALGASSVRSVLAYSSLSHLALMLIGIFSLTNPGKDGCLLQMFSHGLCTAGLFLVVACLAKRNFSETLGDLGGLHQKMPQLSTLALLFSLGALGCPGLSSFPGELSLLAGFYAANPPLALVMSLTVVGAAWYMLRWYQTIFHGPLKQCPEGLKDLSNIEALALYPLAIMVVIVGFAPQLFLMWTRILPW